MKALLKEIENAIESITRLRSKLARLRCKQIRTRADRNLIKATVFAWFQSHKKILAPIEQFINLAEVDSIYNFLLEAAERLSSRKNYIEKLDALKAALVKLRSSIIALPTNIGNGAIIGSSCPDVSKLITDVKMKDIVKRRWLETQKCINVSANLAATVMMGALLEAFLLARVNSVEDKSCIYKAMHAPKEKNTNKTKHLNDWTLANFIDVAHDLEWIRPTAKDLSVQIRDYRNYIHPAKELSHGITLNSEDVSLIWTVFNKVVTQLLNSI